LSWFGTSVADVETYAEVIVAFQNFAAQHSRKRSHALGLEENSLVLASNRTGCEATGKQKLATDVGSFANAEGGCLIVGVTDSRKALEATNILLQPNQS
jgi:hypothetical protein